MNSVKLNAALISWPIVYQAMGDAVPVRDQSILLNRNWVFRTGPDNKVLLHGFSRNSTELMLRCTPHAKSHTGSWMEGRQQRSQQVNQSVVDWLMIPTATNLPISRVQLTPNY